MKKMLRNTIALASMCMVFVALFALPSCKPKDKGVMKSDAKLIGVSLLKENDEFYKSLRTGLEQTAKELGYGIMVLSAENDEARQSANIDALLVKNIAALVICPVNSKGVGSIIQKATDKKVPVFTADIAAETGDVVAHIASDNYQGGQVAAEFMIKQIGVSGKVAIVQIPGTESVSSRVQGFVDTAKKAGLTVIEPYLNGKDDTQESERVSNAAILSNPDLRGIFAANDNMAAGAQQSIISSKKDIVLVGYNASPAAQETIKKGGVWKADVIQYPEEIGKSTVKTIDDFLKGKLKKQDKTIVIPIKVGIYDGK